MSDTLTASTLLSSTDTGTRSLLLLLPEAPEEKQNHVRFLSELHQAGLLGIHVGITQSREVAEAAGRAPVVATDGKTERSLLDGGLLASETLLVISLRPLEMTANDWETERSALLAIQGLLPQHAQDQSRAYTLSLPFGNWANPQALYADWDAHYVLNTTNQPSSSHPRYSLQDAPADVCYGQQLLTALSIAGAWRNAPPPVEARDHHDAGRLPVRFVSSSVRVVYTPSSAPQSGTRHIPTSPPWPLPNGGGCEGATPGSVPGIETVNQTADLLRFRCDEPSPPKTKPPRRFRPWRELPHPKKLNPTEKAAHVFLRRVSENSDILSVEAARLEARAAISRLGLQGVAGELTLSGFGLVAEASAPTPETWTNLYRVCVALVDGSTLPESVERPETHDGDRLVWTHPEAIIAPPAIINPSPPQASISASDEQPGFGDQADVADTSADANDGSDSDRDNRIEAVVKAWRSRRPDAEALLDALPADERNEALDQMWTAHANAAASPPPRAPWPSIPDVQSSEELWLEKQRQRVERSEELRHEKQRQRVERVDGLRPEEDQLDEMQAGLLSTGAEHDRLIARLSAILDLSIRQAINGFCSHAYVENAERDRYTEARIAQLKARTVLQVAAGALIVAFGFVLDHRFGWVASIWESAPLRLYRPTTSPTASIIAMLMVVVIASIPLLRIYQAFMSSSYRLTLANHQRTENSRKLQHYVGELQRLTLIRHQYEDHLKAIQRLLHRPLGDPTTEEIKQAPEIDWFSLEELPPGLLILSAAPSDLLDTEERKRLSKVFSVGWLDAVHAAARRNWEKSFKSRIVAGFEWPEQDAGKSAVPQHRNRVTGGDVMGARTDWTAFVASPTGLEASGKAWLHTELARADRDMNSDYAAMLTDLRSITNHAVCWATASECLAAAVQSPDFDWEHLLSTQAGSPQVNQTQPHSCMIPLHDKGLLALLAWELVSAEPVHHENLPSNEPLLSTTDTDYDYSEDDDV